jgi:hypothetical protein
MILKCTQKVQCTEDGGERLMYYWISNRDIFIAYYLHYKYHLVVFPGLCQFECISKVEASVRQRLLLPVTGFWLLDETN